MLKTITRSVRLALFFTAIFLTFLCSDIRAGDIQDGLFPSVPSIIRGRVLDSADGSPVAYADVAAADSSGRAVSHTVSGEDGTFELPCPENALTVSVRMMGYEPYECGSGDSEALSAIALKRSEESLDEATVLSEKRQIVYKIDRQVISSSASAAASGGTAVDILSSLPSALVDADGNVTFRGSGNFLVYIDGKLSPLEGSDALKQIPSGSVEDIEIITTPSARYRTDGDGPIINVTTRKLPGKLWSGILNLSGSTLGTCSIDGTLNYRRGRNNFYVGGTAQHIKSRSDFHQEKTTIAPDAFLHRIKTISVSDGERWGDNATMVARAGWQYSDGRRNNLSMEVQAGQTDNWRGGDMLYDEARTDLASGASTRSLFDAHDRYNLCKDLFQASLEYVFRPAEKHEFVAASRLRYDRYSIEYTESNLFDQSGERYEGTRGYEEEHHWDCDFNLSYKFHYSDKGSLESGYQYTTYSEHGGYKINYWNREAREFQWQEDLATPFYYRRQVHSIYAMVTQEAGKFKFDAGVRADRVLDLMDIEIVGASRDIKRFNLFPSAHLSYDAGRAGTLTLGYSYRTNRPGIWNLEPYITYEDYYTKKIGNPDIRPEYTHSAELGWRKSFDGGHSLCANAFYKYRHDISEWVRTAYEPGVTLDVIVNAGDRSEKGLEFSGVLKATPWWTSTLGACLAGYEFVSTNELCKSASALYHQLDFLNAFSASKTTKIQLDAHYVGPRLLSQGSEKAFFHCDLALRQQLLKDAMTLSLVCHDVFRTAEYVNERVSPGLESVTSVRPRYPNLILSLGWNFNSSSHKTRSNTDTDLFEGRNF